MLYGIFGHVASPGRRKTILLLLLLVCGAVGVWWYFPPTPRLVLNDATEALAFSPDGKVLLTWYGPDNTLQLRDAATGNIRGAFSYPAAGDRLKLRPDVEFSHDGLLVAVGTGKLNNIGKLSVPEARLRVLRLSDTAEIVDKKVILDPLGTSFAFSADGTSLAYTDNDHEVCVLRLAEPQGPVTRLQARPPVAFSSDGKMLAAITNAVTLWDTATWKPIRTLQELEKGMFQGPTGLTFTPDGQRLVVAADIGSSGAVGINVQDVASGKTLWNGGGRFSDSLGRLSQTAYQNHALHFYDKVQKLELKMSYYAWAQLWDLTPAPPTLLADRAVLSADGRHALAFHKGKEPAQFGGESFAGIDLFDFPGNKKRILFPEDENLGYLAPIAISSDGTRGAVLQERKGTYRLLLVDIPTGQIETSLPSIGGPDWGLFSFHLNAPRTAIFSPDGQTIASHQFFWNVPMLAMMSPVITPVEIWDFSPIRPWGWIFTGWGIIVVLCVVLFLVSMKHRV